MEIFKVKLYGFKTIYVIREYHVLWKSVKWFKMCLGRQTPTDTHTEIEMNSKEGRYAQYNGNNSA